MLEAIISGLTLGCILALSVGPVIFTIIKQSLVNGHTGGFSFVAGVWVSDIVLVIIGNVFAAIGTSVKDYTGIIGFLGSLFLMGLGIFYLFFKKVSLRMDTDGNVTRFRRREMLKIFSSGFFINTLNPSVILLWMGTPAAFAKFSINQRMVVFGLCISINIAADIFKVLLAGKLRNRLTLHNMALINKVSGVILVGFGFALLYGTLFLSDKIK